MATVKPFRGIRPPRNLVEQVASRPYDVLNSDEARAEAAGNPKSLYHIIKPEIDFPAGTDEHDERVYDRAVENFQAFRQNGWLVQDDADHYYIYAQTMDGRTQYGIVVAANVHDYVNGVIKKHELTRRDKEDDRMRHVRINNANIEPVFFAFPDNEILETIIRKVTSAEAEYDFTAPDGFGHHFWVVDDPADIAAITEAFAAMPSLYIADGHHRSAAAARVGLEKAQTDPNHTGDEEKLFPRCGVPRLTPAYHRLQPRGTRPQRPDSRAISKGSRKGFYRSAERSRNLYTRGIAQFLTVSRRAMVFAHGP